MNSILYQNQSDKYLQVRKDIYSVKKSVNSVFTPFSGNSKGQIQQNTPSPQVSVNDYIDTTSSDSNPKLSSMLDVVPTYRRMERVPAKVSRDEVVSAVGLVALAMHNLPEDMRDTISSIKQIKSKFDEKAKFTPSYNYKVAQHPFSFFRGAALDSIANPKKSPFPALAKFLLKHDSTLADSNIGSYLIKLMGVKTKIIQTRIKNIAPSPKYVPALKFISGSYFGEIATRAMLRTTKLGAMALAGIESYHFAKKLNDGYDFSSSVKDSLINFAATVSGIGLVGAIGAKHFGPTGSLIGMGLGSIIGNTIASKSEKKTIKA